MESCFPVFSRKQPYVCFGFSNAMSRGLLTDSLSDQSESFRSCRQLALKSHDINGSSYNCLALTTLNLLPPAFLGYASYSGLVTPKSWSQAWNLLSQELTMLWKRSEVDKEFTARCLKKQLPTRTCFHQLLPSGLLVYSTEVDSQYDFRSCHIIQHQLLYDTTKFVLSHYICRKEHITSSHGAEVALALCSLLYLWCRPWSETRHTVTRGEKGGWVNREGELAPQIHSLLSLRIHIDWLLSKPSGHWVTVDKVTHRLDTAVPYLVTSPYLRDPHCPVLLRNWATE